MTLITSKMANAIGNRTQYQQNWDTFIREEFMAFCDFGGLWEGKKGVKFNGIEITEITAEFGAPKS